MWSQPGVFSVFIILPFLLSYIWYDSCYICNFWQQAFNQVVQAVPIDDWYTTDTLPILDRQFTDILPTFYWCCRDRLSVDRTDGWLVIIRYIGRLVTTHGRYSTDTRPPLDQHPADISTVMATDSQLRCRPLRWWTPPIRHKIPLFLIQWKCCLTCLSMAWIPTLALRDSSFLFSNQIERQSSAAQFGLRIRKKTSGTRVLDSWKETSPTLSGPGSSLYSKWWHERRLINSAHMISKINEPPAMVNQLI